LPSLPAIDWSYPLRHPRVAEIAGATLAALVAVAVAAGVRKARELKRRFAQGFAILRRPRRFVARVLTWQALSWAFRLASVFWFLRAFGVPATWRNSLLVQVVQSLSTVLPFTPGGIGTEQGLLVYAFRGRIPAAHLLSFSVGAHVTVVVVNVVLGFAAIAILLRTVRWRRIVGRERPT
jgi:uncharacterized protein (TIRG00374 family)